MHNLKKTTRTSAPRRELAEEFASYYYAYVEERRLPRHLSRRTYREGYGTPQMPQAGPAFQHFGDPMEQGALSSEEKRKRNAERANGYDPAQFVSRGGRDRG
ncbi:hypothetical protein LTR17_000077 [Elasticomyces elasticus]|nr:hypothetical protein LTR17_000077 [Elasticomyces elasticus]